MAMQEAAITADAIAIAVIIAARMEIAVVVAMAVNIVDIMVIKAVVAMSMIAVRVANTKRRIAARMGISRWNRAGHSQQNR
jgi:predicted lysophospholipase L1 biosynthesis ABC-type transport system permease subunit